MIIDARNLIVGRMASIAAKELLKGEKVIIVNAGESIISGSKSSILEKYRERRERKSIVNPARHGPFFPRRPEGIVRRAVRGMLPYKKAKGKNAFKSLKVYAGIPKELEGNEMETIEVANASKLRVPKYIKLKELCNLLGAKF
ncbi:MAG: 50S ribosomal protein L13 [Candidatus Hydrothermarchaeota archaeon]|nr:50S ribosomal protein L13 [Candidatus Hydrothermarchaeota archaeon]